jgi:putative aminopeptidase FrvX
VTDLTIDLDGLTSFLVELLNIHSPTGYTPDAIAYCERRFAALGNLSITHQRKGGLMMRLKGRTDLPPIGLTAHVDTLGLMVRDIKGDGRLQVERIGGLLWNGAESENVTVRTYDGRTVRGTLVLTNTSTHVNRDAGMTERNERTMEVRLDAKTTSRAQTEALGVGVGDFVFLDPRVEVTETGFVKARFLDDKASVACLWAALKAMNDAGLTPERDIILHLSNYEEVGHGGASDWPSDLEELLSIDMGAIGAGQNGDEFSVSICAKDGGGPYHHAMVAKLRALCEAHAIPYKVDLYIYYSSDGTAYWRAGGGARVGLAGPGIAGSHSYERTHQDSLLHSAHLLARYMLA